MIPKKSYVKFLNKPLYEQMKEDTSVSHFIEIMSPFERACYDFSIQVEKAAESFAVAFILSIHSRWNQVLILDELIVR